MSIWTYIIIAFVVMTVIVILIKRKRSDLSEDNNSFGINLQRIKELIPGCRKGL